MKMILKIIRDIILRTVIFLTSLGGPPFAILLYVSGENREVDPMECLTLIKEIFICYIISVLIAVIFNFLIKGLWISILTSTGICLLTYLVLYIFFRFDKTDPEHITWLPVGLLFVCINCFPMAFSASGSTILQIRFNAFIKALIKEFK